MGYDASTINFFSSAGAPPPQTPAGASPLDPITKLISQF